MEVVSIIIVNWNAGDLLRECIDSIFKFGEEYVKEIIVVDNCSSDGSVAGIETEAKIKLIVNSKNLGFAKACNIGFRKATGEYVLLLNPDTRIKEGTLIDCINFISANTKVDILGCRHVDEIGRTKISCARFPTSKTFLNDIVGLSKISPKYFPSATLMTDWDHESSREVDQVMGAFMFMRTKIFEKHGYFDERFFVFFEELDFCLRVKQSGGRVFYNAEISIYHKGRGTTGKDNFNTLSLSVESRLKFIKKHLPFPSYLILSVSTFTIEPVSRIIQSILRGNITAILKIPRAFFKVLTINRAIAC